MEILKRARGEQDGEGVSVFANEKDVREEVNHRTWKAGYTDRDGQPNRSTGAGKGDVPRPCNKKQYDEGYIRAFGHN